MYMVEKNMKMEKEYTAWGTAEWDPSTGPREISDGYAIASCGLAREHGPVGPPNDRLRAFVHRCQDSPDGNGDTDRLSPFRESGTFDEATEFLADGVELFLVHVYDEDNELISPPPPHDVEGPDPVQQGPGDHPDHPIADDVVVSVVYLLEVVNVHEQDTDPPPVAVLLVETVHELLLEEAPVPDLRERIEKGKVSELLVKLGHCRYPGVVREYLDRPHHTPRPVEYRGGPYGDGHPISVPVLEIDLGL